MGRLSSHSSQCIVRFVETPSLFHALGVAGPEVESREAAEVLLAFISTSYDVFN